MKRFQFRLQTVLEHRQRKETIAHLSHGEALAQLNHAAKYLEELEEARQGIILDLNERLIHSDFDPDEIRSYHDYINNIRTFISEQQVYVMQLTATVEARRLSLVGASQQRQVLDHMKTSAQIDHMSTMQRLEQVSIDDSAATRRQFLQLQKNQEN